MWTIFSSPLLPYYNNICLSVGCRPFLHGFRSISLSVPLLNSRSCISILRGALHTFSFPTRWASMRQTPSIPYTSARTTEPGAPRATPIHLLKPPAHLSCNLRCRPIKQGNLTGLCISPFSSRGALEPYTLRRRIKPQSSCGPLLPLSYKYQCK